MRRYHQGKKPIYKYDAWKIIEDSFQAKLNHRGETIFALGNGYIGIRGTFEEGLADNIQTTTPGTYINGVYDSEKIQYGEFVYGMPEYNQTLVNLADWKSIRVQLGDEWIEVSEERLMDYQRFLDLKNGILVRTMTWRSQQGREVKIKVQRCISLTDIHHAVIRYEIIPVNFADTITISSEIDGNVQNYHHKLKQKIKVVQTEVEGNQGQLLQRTNLSDITIAFAMQNKISSSAENFDYKTKRVKDDQNIAIKYSWDAKKGQSYTLEKYISFYTSKDLDSKDIVSDPSLSSEDKRAKELDSLVRMTVAEINRAAELGFVGILKRQREFLEIYWEDVDVQIAGDPALQQGVRFNAYHLLQSTGRDGETSIGAKGVTGEYYEGHYFWDTEVYIVPFFLYSRPEIVRNLLLYRYNKLDQARMRARVLRNKGALYPWRTINGHEASVFFEGSTAQYHINAAIVYGIYKYVEATDDYQFMVNYGAEIIFETSRLWADRGGFVKLKGNKFCINEVCGPDEYKSGVNNNCYTNYMARFNLQLGVEIAKMLKERHPDEYRQLVEKISLKEEEISYWQRCADEMYLPFNEELGIHPQDDSFLYKEEIDVNALPKDQIPLVRNWHPLNIWRYQLCKQADVILLMFIQGGLFDLEIKKANYNYYEPKTTHDSSLSTSIFSIIASEIGYYTDAYNYFMQTARLDLDDYNGNAHEGIHSACMAGSWLGVTHGFAGMRVSEGILHFHPYLPDSWNKYQFNVKLHGRSLQIKVDNSNVCYRLRHGKDLKFYHGNEEIWLAENEERCFPL